MVRLVLIVATVRTLKNVLHGLKDMNLQAVQEATAPHPYCSVPPTHHDNEVDATTTEE